MAIIHLVLLAFKEDATPEAIAEARLLALKDNCLHATTKAPYIKSVTGGINNSPEGRNNGLTHGFSFEFNSLEDRAYYLKEDPAHLGLVGKAVPLVEKLTVFDYETGVF
ncbi:uncharacterized protein TRIVIDRAFT_34890 [Trichoderma virens Gv29-8]|uniref:Stress-response A/B barrel domain-containing protein n=1 Tax=Hypocrea virens (strain Gv29-8 / FGSC 10586) TaxID=413071 RepID=G9MDP2_HYPVG|nr:uncharacterized protein TRIVIDRAFT_34890 [Trichoderma virens Gv29-8]EHK27201.1 hypothetical protein TRIVIDRAFT_34890 [Trichoderma virens Gv29-8]UKZ57662.1 hypothetical protein TrVGV298_011522 [Trichoderma virens]